MWRSSGHRLTRVALTGLTFHVRVLPGPSLAWLASAQAIILRAFSPFDVANSIAVSEVTDDHSDLKYSRYCSSLFPNTPSPMFRRIMTSTHCIRIHVVDAASASRLTR